MFGSLIDDHTTTSSGNGAVKSPMSPGLFSGLGSQIMDQMMVTSPTMQKKTSFDPFLRATQIHEMASPIATQL